MNRRRNVSTYLLNVHIEWDPYSYESYEKGFAVIMKNKNTIKIKKSKFYDKIIQEKM